MGYLHSDFKNIIERAMILCKEDWIATISLVLPEPVESQWDGMSLDQIAAFLIGSLAWILTSP
jgi:hypothetical protein